MSRFIRLAAVSVLALAPIGASAHAFGVQYTLPIPVSLYIGGASAALVLSFVVLLFTSQRPLTDTAGEGRLILGAKPTQKILTALRALLIVAFTAAIITGFFGDQAPTNNFAPLLFWVYFLLGFAYLSVFVQGLWNRVNPFLLPIPFLRHGAPDKTLPRSARYLPALILYLLLIWVELLSGGAGAVPAYIALGLIGYWLVSWGVVDRYGKEVWQEYGDVFGVFFRTIGFLAPLSVTERGVTLVSPIQGAAHKKAESLWLVMFILSVLALTAFDGFRETAPYAHALTFLAAFIPFSVLEILSFGAMPLLFFGTYALCIFFVAYLRGSTKEFFVLLKRYAYSLVPIAIVYHFAHYFTLLIVQGQSIVSIISDPLGRGWNLFGSAGYKISPGVIGADTVWHVQLAAIVLGHIMALYLSHLVTNELITDKKRAVIAELPLLVVMVFYTAFGLWILSRPFAL
jgi:hypothetical protein